MQNWFDIGVFFQMFFQLPSLIYNIVSCNQQHLGNVSSKDWPFWFCLVLNIWAQTKIARSCHLLSLYHGQHKKYNNMLISRLAMSCIVSKNWEEIFYSLRFVSQWIFISKKQFWLLCISNIEGERCEAICLKDYFSLCLTSYQGSWDYLLSSRMTDNFSWFCNWMVGFQILLLFVTNLHRRQRK